MDCGGCVLRPLAEGKFRFESARDGRIGRTPDGAPSWFGIASAHSELVSRVGFVLSLMFLSASAIYALYLSGKAAPLVSEFAALVDQAASQAGFRLDDVAISGTRNTPRTMIIEALKQPKAASSLFYDTFEAHNRLLAIGWIESAEVRRVFPSQLQVTVSERSPFARWSDAQSTVNIIDRQGRVLGSDDGSSFEYLPLFSGEGAAAEAASFIDALAGHDALLQRMLRIDLVAERFWLVKLDSGISLKLPRNVNPLTLEQLEKLLANAKIAEAAIAVIDLRVPRRTILQLREPTPANRNTFVTSLIASQAAITLRRGAL